MREADDLLCRAEEDAAADLLDSAGIQSLRSVHAVCRQAVQDRADAPPGAVVRRPIRRRPERPRPRANNCRSSGRDRDRGAGRHHEVARRQQLSHRFSTGRRCSMVASRDGSEIRSDSDAHDNSLWSDRPLDDWGGRGAAGAGPLAADRPADGRRETAARHRALRREDRRPGLQVRLPGDQPARRRVLARWPDGLRADLRQLERRRARHRRAPDQFHSHLRLQDGGDARHRRLQAAALRPGRQERA